MWKKYCRAGQATDESIILHRKDAIFTPDKYGKYTHTFIVSNSCFSLATVITRTHLNVTCYVHSPSCYLPRCCRAITFNCRFSRTLVYCFRNVVAHGDTREGKWRGNWRMEGVTNTLTPPRQVVYPALLTLMRTPRLPAVEWTDSPADLNGLVRLGGR